MKTQNSCSQFTQLNSYKKFLLLILLFAPGISAGQWTNHPIMTNGGNMIAVDFLNANTGMTGGWVLGNEVTAKAYYTFNGGLNWSESSYPDSIRVFTDIQIISATTALGVGAYNHPPVNRSSIPGVSHSFSDLDNHNASFSGGDQFYDAIILRTTNSGRDWFPFGNVDPFYDYFYQLELIDSNRMFVSGTKQSNTVYMPGISYSSDGGEHWSMLQTPVAIGNYNEIRYRNGTLFAAGNEVKDSVSKGVIISSSDNGVSWVKDVFNEVDYFTGINFINNNTGYACGVDETDKLPYNSSIYKTTNAGKDWIRQNRNLDSIMINGVCVKENSSRVLFYGSVFVGDPKNPYTRAFIDVSSNSGVSWLTRSIFGYNTNLVNSCYVDSSNIFVTGGEFIQKFPDIRIDPLILHTTNAGYTFANMISSIVPDNFSLEQNYPNPFNPATSIRFNVTQNSGRVELKVFDILGNEVATLVNEKKAPGTYEVKFDGNNLTSGIYFYRIKTDNFSDTKKMILLK